MFNKFVTAASLAPLQPLCNVIDIAAFNNNRQFLELLFCQSILRPTSRM
jgi:hypothetical protein